jgi:hypothetical protein
MASRPGGKVSPSVFAVVRLMTNSSLVDCMTRKVGRLFRREAVQQSTGAILPIRRQWIPEEREQLLTLERPRSAPTAEAKKSLASTHLAE